MSALALAAAGVTGGLSLVRWLRVSQREHYLPRAIAHCAARWLRTRPPNRPAAIGWTVLVVAAVVLAISGEGIAAAAVGVAAAMVGALLPVGMAVVGTPRLRFTRRAILQAVTAAVVAGVVLWVVNLLLGAGPVAALSPAFVAMAVDVAAVANQPLERRIAGRFRRAADEKLRRGRPKLIAITGSYGKTSVKNHVRDLVATTFATLATPASWNNMAGLSRAINEQLTPATEVFVAEMGTYGVGEIRALVEWLRPEISVITAIGPVHLERMRTLETIVAAKSEIITGARVAVIAVDNPRLQELADRVEAEGSVAELWRVGSDASRSDLDVLVAAAHGDESLVISVRGETVAELSRGALHPSNVACAVAAALAAGVDRRALTSALPKLTASASRAATATSERGITVVDDTFNSNPSGASAALALLRRHVPDGRRAVVTPGMVELGELQDDANRDFAWEVDKSGADLVIVGWTNRAALRAGHRTPIAVPNREAARQWVRANLAAGDGVLWENDLPDHYP